MLDYLRREEVTALLGWLDVTEAKLEARTLQQTRPMIWTGLYTGLRKGELLGLRWIDVHLDAMRIDVNRSYGGLPKSGKPRYLPLHPDLAPVLRTWRERQTHLVASESSGLVSRPTTPARAGRWARGATRSVCGSG